jgi:integrating conjugative element relaxase (TIGR03760 family)
MFARYALFVQQLPASEAHHHAGAGGLLAHGLEVTEQALKLRRARLLPPGAAAEDIARRRDLWTYATAACALLHDLGKPVVDQVVALFDAQGRPLGPWVPWTGPMGEGEAAWYSTRFRRDRRHHLHTRAALLLSHTVVPQPGLQWLASDLEVFEAWTAALIGDLGTGSVLAEILMQADALSVASDLAGEQVQRVAVQARPLAERLIAGLRHLVEMGALSLNREGAAGWIVGDDLWLVVKRALDALRDHLLAEGQTGVPARNDRLMDELQQHALLVPNGERAVWLAEVQGQGWSKAHKLTLLRLPLAKVWPQPSGRPTAFLGRVTPVPDGARVLGSDADPDTGPRSALPGRGDGADETQVRPPAVAQAKLPGSVPGAPEAGWTFLEWVREGLRSGRLAMNSPQARIHTVAEGLLLVSPALFQAFDSRTWAEVQKRFQKLKLHRKAAQGMNIHTYLASGDAKPGGLLNGFLIPNPGAV